jgi:hypothetical protein
MKFGTKVEIFAQPPPEKEESDSQDGDQNKRPETSQSEEENRKMYTALLQNQVLGIDNPYLLHEIHDSDELVGQKDRLYSFQMREQQAMPPPEPRRVSSFAMPEAQEASPFNSKFTVLKFNKSPMTGSSSGRHASSKYSSSGSSSKHDSTPQKRELFGNASNFTPVPFNMNRNMQFGLPQTGAVEGFSLTP